ncbi:MAG: hypothetical protein JWO46_1826 [Nocardioidaceae bacterium]|nr:hypothetical protein [Nocardioidaceae bacterium]
MTGPTPQLLADAAELIITGGEPTARQLQVNLGIGATRARRLLTLLEQHGVVGPVNEGRQRDVLVTRDQLTQVLNSLPQEGTP